jgi:hypothetical protein
MRSLVDLQSEQGPTQVVRKIFRQASSTGAYYFPNDTEYKLHRAHPDNIHNDTSALAGSVLSQTTGVGEVTPGVQTLRASASFRSFYTENPYTH